MTSPAHPPRPQGHITIENVTVGYELNRPVIRGLSLDIAPGKTVALGPTGAGKTTVAGLVPRFFDPWEGRVLVDGHDVRDVQLSSLRRNVGLGVAGTVFVPLSIAENIALWPTGGDDGGNRSRRQSRRG